MKDKTMKPTPTRQEFIAATCDSIIGKALDLAESVEALRLAVEITQDVEASTVRALAAFETTVGGLVRPKAIDVPKPVEVSYTNGKPLAPYAQRDRKSAQRRADALGFDLKDFALRVGYLRRTFFRGTMSEFGELLGVSGECARGWERGIAFPTTKNLHRLERMTVLALGAPEFWKLPIGNR